MDLGYSRGKLWGNVTLFGFFGACALWLFLNPLDQMGGSAGLLMSGNFGHYFTVPLIVIVSLVLTTRCAMMAVGSLEAVDVDDAGLTITTLWSSRRIAWRDLLQVRLHERRVRRTPIWSLKFDQREGSTVTLPLATTELRPDAYYDYAQRLAQRHLDVVRGVSPVEAVRPDIVPAAPARPAFGRKVA